jgi:hypothetical protein
MAVVMLISMGERIGGSVVSSSAEGQSPRFGVQFCCESNDESQANSPREWREWRQGGARGQACIELSAPVSGLVRHTLDWAASAVNG